MLKAIETVYNGYRFRSRLEARWAVFFDALGIEYQYEPEGFDLGEAGWYLPDFWLPNNNLHWIEIKPRTDEWPEHAAFGTLPSFAVICGDPWVENNDVGRWLYEGYQCSSGMDFHYNAFIHCDSDYRWCECPKCSKIGLQFDGRSGRNCNCFDYDKVYNTHSPRLLAAYTAARQARFEHGQVGALGEWGSNQ